MSETTPALPTVVFDPHAGPFTSSDALNAGVTRWGLAQLVSRQEVRHLLTDLYVPWDYPDTLEDRAIACSLLLPRHAVAVDSTAAWIWDVDTRRPWEMDIPPRVEFFVLRGNTRVRRMQVRSGVRDLSPADVTHVSGVAVTTPLRTSLDLACRRGAYGALAAMDGLARAQGVDSEALLRELPRFRRRRGVVQARRLVPLVDGRAESSGESFVRLAMHEAGLPKPEPQYWITIMGVPTYRLDLAYPRLKICVEYDGEEFHTSPERREADRKRRKWLRDHGWLVVVVRKDGFKGAAMDAWLQEVSQGIRERSRR